MARTSGSQRSDTQRLERLLVAHEVNRRVVDARLNSGTRQSYAHVLPLYDDEQMVYYVRVTARLQQIKAKLMVQGLWT